MVIDEENNPDRSGPKDAPPARWVPIEGGEVAGPSAATEDEIARADVFAHFSAISACGFRS